MRLKEMKYRRTTAVASSLNKSCYMCHTYLSVQWGQLDLAGLALHDHLRRLVVPLVLRDQLVLVVQVNHFHLKI